jgi:hypothetical protein
LVETAQDLRIVCHHRDLALFGKIAVASFRALGVRTVSRRIGFVW